MNKYSIIFKNPVWFDCYNIIVCFIEYYVYFDLVCEFVGDVGYMNMCKK